MKYHFIRDLVWKGAMKLQYIRMDEQIIDITTKPIKTTKFVYFHDKLAMAENTSLAKSECWFFLSNIESHSLRRMGTSGQGPGCGTSLALGELILVLSSHSVEWRHLVKDQDVELVQHWWNLALSWVAILLNGDIWSRTKMWNQSKNGGTQPWAKYPLYWIGTSGQWLGCGTSPSLGELNLKLSSHSDEWGHLVKDKDVEPIQHWGNST